MKESLESVSSQSNLYIFILTILLAHSIYPYYYLQSIYLSIELSIYLSIYQIYIFLYQLFFQLSLSIHITTSSLLIYLLKYQYTYLLNYPSKICRNKQLSHKLLRKKPNVFFIQSTFNNHIFLINAVLKTDNKLKQCKSFRKLALIRSLKIVCATNQLNYLPDKRLIIPTQHFK